MKITLKTILILLITFSSTYGQFREPLFLVHDRGELWETVKDNGQLGGLFSDFQYFPSLDWPGGPGTLPSKDEQRSYMQGAGVWIGGVANGSLFFNEMGPFSYADQGTFFDMVETENFIGSPDFDPNEAEEKIITRFIINNSQMEVKRISRTWSYPAYADFIILEYRFINRSGGAMSDVYLGFPYLIWPSYQDILVQGQWGDNLNVTDEIAGYDESRHLLYAYDSYPADYITSLGNYYEARKELRTPGYAGFAPLYYDSAADASPQPATVFYAQTLNNTQLLTLANRSVESMVNLLTGNDTSIPVPLVDERVSPFLMLGFGPYQMNAGDSVTIVIAEAVNGLPMEDVVDVEPAQLESIQALLPMGLDSLQHTIDRAQLLYDNNYVPQSLAPPAPEVEYFVLPSTQEIAITWEPGLEDWIDPLTGEDDLKEYTVYRSDRSFIGPFKKLRGIRVDRRTDQSRYFDDELGKWSYKDNSVQVGVGYYYMVTSMDSAGHESGKTNRNERALVTARLAAENTLNVSVFPNPFRLVSGLPTAGEENSIVFTKLPAECIIRIYTVNGELVRTLEHSDPNRDEEVWDQLTDSRQKTAAGIYLYTVDSDVGTAKGTILLIK